MMVTVDISRADLSLDREEQDYSLEVASAGVSSPLKKIRQYKKT
jgi:ribosome maturation factor RimP